MAIAPLGIDNVLFDVDDLDAAVRFYERCGLALRWRFDEKGIALFAIGAETPGLLLRKRTTPDGGRLWVEVEDAEAVAGILEAEGIQTNRIETRTGITIEAADPSGNVIGFADYSRSPETGRGRR